MFERFYALSVNTFLETIRQPLYGVMLMAIAFLLVLNVSLAAFTLEDDNKLLLDLGLSTLLLGGLFLSAFSASSVLGREIEEKTVLVVVSKPVNRPLLFLGKFAGLWAALAVAFYLSLLVFILAQRHGVLQNSSDPWDAPVLAFGGGSLALALVAAGFCNYFYGKEFSVTAIALATPLLTAAVLGVGKLDEKWNVIPFGSNFIDEQVLIAAYLVFLNVVIIAAVALAASTRFGQTMTLVIATCVLGLGVVSDYAFGQYEQTSVAAAAAYRLVPNMGVYWVIDGLHAGAEETTVPLSYVAYASAYAALQTVAILSVGIAAFQRREVG
jgi:ABC-type transport system involved in multi-copper enzyme maturation permease subunit